MTYRRSGRLRTVPFVAVVAVVVGLLARHNDGAVVLLAFAVAVWTISALLRSREVLTIDGSTLTVRLPLGGATLNAADVVGARFERVHANGRSLMLNVVLVELRGGGRLPITTWDWSPAGAWPAIRGWLVAAGVGPERLPAEG
jgi:hypothetical protein